MVSVVTRGKCRACGESTQEGTQAAGHGWLGREQTENKALCGRVTQRLFIGAGTPSYMCHRSPIGYATHLETTECPSRRAGLDGQGVRSRQEGRSGAQSSASRERTCTHGLSGERGRRARERCPAALSVHTTKLCGRRREEPSATVLPGSEACVAKAVGGFCTVSSLNTCTYITKPCSIRANAVITHKS